MTKPKRDDESPDPFDLQSVFEVDDYLYFYSDDLTDERTEAEVASLVRLLALDSRLKILDLACGFGRHANRLAALGHEVTGIDLTPGFLEIARRKASELGLRVDFRQGDMRQIDFHEEFDRVLLLFTSFGYFGDQANALVVKNMAQALKPGGLLIFDSLNRDVAARDFLRPDVIEKEGNLMINRPSFDPLSGRFHNRRIVIRDGVRRDKPFSIRLYGPQEVRALLGEAGLEVHGILDERDRPLSSDSRRMVVIARKPKRS